MSGARRKRGIKAIRWIGLALVAALPALGTLARAAEPGSAAGAAAPARALHTDPQPKLTPESDYATRLFRALHYLPPTIEIPDGFTDGGRGMHIHGDGRLTSSRELVQVDRGRDEYLRQYIEHATGKEILALKPMERAVRIGQYVNDLMSKCGGRMKADDEWDRLVGQYRGQGVMLGEITDVYGAGVCRHRTPLFKLLANAAGLKVAMVRGNYRHSDGRIGGHAWNELYLDDGSVYVVDVMSPPRGWRFPAISEPFAQKYLSMGKVPLYADGKLPWPPAIELGKPPTGKGTQVTLVPPVPDAKVFYTLDGSQPTAESKKYAAPFKADAGTNVRAIAVYPDGRTSGTMDRPVPAP